MASAHPQPVPDTGEITVEAASALWPADPDFAARLGRIARATLDTACPGIGPAGLAILLADDARSRDLNRTWRGQDKPTNVLSFPATDTMAGETPVAPGRDMPLELGDIVLGFETCRLEAEMADKSLIEHACHLVVHGTLHLVGHDHAEDAAALAMERLEVLILAEFGIADPYDEGVLAAPADG